MDCHQGACCRATAVACRLGHGADDLVTQDHGCPQDGFASRAVHPVMQIGAADAAIGNLDDVLVGGRLTERYRLDPEIIGGVRDDAEGFGGDHGCQTTAVMPPSTNRTCPLTKSEAGEARNTRAPIRSSTLPQRPAGVRPLTHALNSSSSTRALVSSVSKYPGASALAWMPEGPRSAHRPLVSMTMPPLVAL